MANRRISIAKYPGVFGINQKDIAYGGAILAGFALDKLDRFLVAHATDKRKVTFQGSRLIPIRVGTDWFFCDTDVNIDASADLDTGSLEAGKDYCIYACVLAGTLVFKTSLNTTYPSGFTATTSRKIGGFHTLCADVGTISGHTLSGYVNKDILPQSIWDLKFRARCGNNAGMVYDPKSGLWIDIYLASGTGANTASVNGGTISDSRTWLDFVDDGGAIGKILLDDSEFQLAATGSNEQTNITGSADPVTTTGHSDTSSRRMISNIGCEDMCGAMWQWLRDQSFRCDPDGTVQAASLTFTVYYAASPGGNPVYLKQGADGIYYLACNMAVALADKYIGSTNYKLPIKHEAAAATGAIAQVYYYNAGSHPVRLIANISTLAKDVFIPTNNPVYQLQIAHNASASSTGVALNYDDTDLRLEAVVPGAANGAADLALNSQNFSWKSIGGSKGQLYSQGSAGDVKLLAGGYWYLASFCGSRARAAASYRWYTASSFGARFRSEPQ